MTTIILVVLAYLIGCLNAGFYLVRATSGEDLRTLGSGTLGARNTGRVLGRPGFVLALAGDALKGVVAVALVAAVRPGLAPAAAVAVVVGHLLPVQLGLRGGKGLATMLGVTAALSPVVAAAGVGVSALALALARRPGPAAVAGVVSAPVVALAVDGPGARVAALAAIAALVVARHAPAVATRFAPSGAGEEGP